MDNVRRVFNSLNKKLFNNGRQWPLGQSAGGHNDLLPQLQQENNNNADNSKFATDEGEATDNADTDEESAEDVAEGNGTENSWDNDADDEVDDASSDLDDMADPGGAAAEGGRASRTKLIIPTFAGKGNNIF